MNIFYLSNDVTNCARQHVDKHVVKMVLEYGQLMSTAHRVLDGVPYEGRTVNNRRIQRWLLPDEREQIIWKASHVKHPSGIWLRSSSTHYRWLYSLWLELCSEYTFRYGKRHSAERMTAVFSQLPKNIPNLGWLCEPPKAMPDEYKVEDTIQSYRNYYIRSKRSFAVWKNRPAPFWFT
jgi:hypothetical protein